MSEMVLYWNRPKVPDLWRLQSSNIQNGGNRPMQCSRCRFPALPFLLAVVAIVGGGDRLALQPWQGRHALIRESAGAQGAHRRSLEKCPGGCVGTGERRRGRRLTPASASARRART